MPADTRLAESGTSQPSNAGPGNDGRNAFLGRWKLEGRQLDSPVGHAAKITAEETYEWLTGQSFVIHRFEGRVGDAEAACIEIIGRDPKSGSYPTHTFYDNGVANEWESREENGAWRLTGTWRIEEKPVRVRCTTFFGDGGDTRTSKWELSNDGSRWEGFWDVTARRVK